MERNDFEKLTEVLLKSLGKPNAGIPMEFRGTPVSERAGEPAVTFSRDARTPSESSMGDAALIASELASLRSTVQQISSSTRSAATKAPDNSRDAGSIGSTVLKTMGRVTGIGPVATGLLSLFGGGGKDEREPEPMAMYQGPASVHVEAGVMSDGRLSDISYGDRGVARSNTRSTTQSNNGGANSTLPQAPSAPAIQINVQAMDSRSFLDHSNDIARAVREAMLHSHALNDVVSEL